MTAAELRAMTVSQLLAKDAEIGNALDIKNLWEGIRPAVLSARKAVRAELEYRRALAADDAAK